MKVMWEMTMVAKCTVHICTYNQNERCHARAITVGDGVEPHCDTYFSCGKHCKSGGQASVGACKVADCRFNIDYECTNPGIEVEMYGGAARCCACEPMR